MGDGRTFTFCKKGYDGGEPKAIIKNPSSRRRRDGYRLFWTDCISSIGALSCRSAWKGDL